MWTNYFNRIFLINLPERRDRLEKSETELKKWNIPYQVIPAIKDEDGAKGLFRTMLDLFNSCMHFDRILVFEDDVKLLCDPSGYMPNVITQIDSRRWDLLYLGVNTHKPFPPFVDNNLLSITEGRSTHAVAYSNRGILKVLKKAQHNRNLPFDMLLESLIQPEGNSYCTYPLIATQQADYSDIEKKDVNPVYIYQRYYDNLKHLGVA